MVRLFAAVLLLLSACAARREAEAPADIAAIREAERRLGVEPTGNFGHASHRPAYGLCYFTGKLELPESYDGLRWKEIESGRCPADPDRFDVFTYRPEALAGRESPVTAALAESQPERAAFVIAHEDFHDQAEIRRLPASLDEAAATLAGLLTAIEHARLTAGSGSAAFEKANRAPAAFGRKAERVNAAFQRLRDLYSEAKAAGVSREGALERKREEFERLAADCEGEERFESFHACPAALNNAGLAFDHTYTQDYPLLWEAHQALGGDAAGTVAFLREELPSAGKKAEEVRAFVRRRIAQAAGATE